MAHWDDTQYTEDDSIVGVESGAEGRLETYGSDLVKLDSIDVKNLWTVLDVDGKLIISAGRHFVNRFYYVITVEQWTDINEEYIYD